jgi:hypothetical protein
VMPYGVMGYGLQNAGSNLTQSTTWYRIPENNTLHSSQCRILNLTKFNLAEQKVKVQCASTQVVLVVRILVLK